MSANTRAIVFSGQGAQFVGMGKDLAAAHPECRALFAQADEVLGYALSAICFEGPADELTKSNHCQPAIFVASMACYQALKARQPDVGFAGAAGLSLGEWSALHLSGALSYADTLRVLEARGRFMQEACEEQDGAMLSVIGLSPDELRRICEATGVTIANLNSPAQTVLSGPREAVDAAGKLAADAGAKRAIPLQVAGAFHSPLMESAARRLEEVLAAVEVQTPRIPVVSNVSGLPHGGPDDIRRNMIAQVTGAVRWQASIEWFGKEGVTEYVECGPGKVLTGLIKRIDKTASLHNVYDVPSLEKTVAAL